MASTGTGRTTRTPLTGERVLEGAVALADRIGVETVTIRRLADELDTRPMTLYHHVENKDAILEGMVDLVFAEIALPPTEVGWRDAIRHRCVSAREVLGRHPWAVPLMESRPSPGPATLHHHDAVLGCLFDAGLPTAVVAHAYAIVDAFVYGFAVQEASLPADGHAGGLAEIAEQMLDAMATDDLPHLTRFTADHVLRPDYDFAASFEVGLDLILDGIEGLAAGAGR